MKRKSSRQPEKAGTDPLYDAALKFLAQAFSKPPEPDLQLRMEVLARATQCGVAHSGSKVWLAPRDSDLRELIEEAASGNYLSYRAALEIAASFVARREVQPLPLQEFVTITAIGKWRPPVKPKIYDGDNAFRAWAIRNAMYNVINTSFSLGIPIKATRNEATSKQRSACDIVAEAMRAIGRKPDAEATVRKVWDKRDDVIRRVHPRYGKLPLS